MEWHCSLSLTHHYNLSREQCVSVQRPRAIASARRHSTGRPREEGERAARVERVPERRRRRRQRERALPVQVVVAARVRAAEARADAHLAAPVAPEWRVVVLQPEAVLRVAEVRHLAVPHRRRREQAGTTLPVVALFLREIVMV